MEWDRFRSKVTELKSVRPIWFGLESDPPASESDIALAEESLGATLPQCYREFVKEFGGGYFALGNVFSVDPKSDWNIVRRNAVACIHGFVCVADNGVGDYYGFRVADGKCEECIHFWDHEEPNSLKETGYRDLFELIDAIALRSS